MSVEFPRGRLFVGWRGMNWSKVYYEPHAQDEGQGDVAPELLIYEKPTAKESLKNPIAGEVNWLPHFDPTTVSHASAWNSVVVEADR